MGYEFENPEVIEPELTPSEKIYSEVTSLYEKEGWTPPTYELLFKGLNEDSQKRGFLSYDDECKFISENEMQ